MSITWDRAIEDDVTSKPCHNYNPEAASVNIALRPASNSAEHLDIRDGDRAGSKIGVRVQLQVIR